MKKKTATSDDNSIYENVRICCQHGKPCVKGRTPREERLIELAKVSPQLAALPPPAPEIEEENAYENLDPNKPKSFPEKADKFYLGDDQQTVKRPPVKKKAEETSTTEDSTESVSEKPKKGKKSLVTKQYLGTLSWREAESKARFNRVLLYHQSEDEKKALFMLISKKAHIFRHYRIMQKPQHPGGSLFNAEDGNAQPKSFNSLEQLVEHYRDSCYYK